MAYVSTLVFLVLYKLLPFQEKGTERFCCLVKLNFFILILVGIYTWSGRPFVRGMTEFWSKWQTVRATVKVWSKWPVVRATEEVWSKWSMLRAMVEVWSKLLMLRITGEVGSNSPLTWAISLCDSHRLNWSRDAISMCFNVVRRKLQNKWYSIRITKGVLGNLCTATRSLGELCVLIFSNISVNCAIDQRSTSELLPKKSFHPYLQRIWRNDMTGCPDYPDINIWVQ